MDLIATGKADEMLPRTAAGSRALGWWGMVLFIATEATLFALLIASYWYLRFRSTPEWPPDGIEAPGLALPLVMSAILWSSSIPMHLADRGIRRGRQRTLRLGLAASFTLGAAFLTLQVAVEYPETLPLHPPSSGIYGALFFSLTGLHGLHVLAGLLLSAWVQVRARAGAFDEHRHVTVGNLAMYWHFVDVVWLFVLVTIYLTPHI